MLNVKKLLTNLLGMYVVESVNPSETFSVGGNATKQQTIDVSKTGYTPIGIVGINTEDNGSSQNNLNIYAFYISGNNARVCYKNLTSSAASVYTKVKVLYKLGGGTS